MLYEARCNEDMNTRTNVNYIRVVPPFPGRILGEHADENTSTTRGSSYTLSEPTRGHNDTWRLKNAVNIECNVAARKTAPALEREVRRDEAITTTTPPKRADHVAPRRNSRQLWHYGEIPDSRSTMVKETTAIGTRQNSRQP